MKKMYRASTSDSDRIDLVEVERETECCVVVRGYRYSKRLPGCVYVDSFKEAKDWLVAHYKEQVKVATENLDWRMKQLAKAEALTDGK